MLDSRGAVLATSRIAKTVCADPSLIGTNQLLVARTIAPILGLDVNGMAKRMQRRVYTDAAGRQREDKHVVLKRKVLLEDWQRITNALANLEFGVDVKTLPRKERLALYNVKHRSIFSERVDSQLRVYRAEISGRTCWGCWRARSRQCQGSDGGARGQARRGDDAGLRA